MSAEGGGIYLDHSATTPLDPEVLEAMLPYLTGSYGNASSTHLAGRRARRAVDTAREQAAALIGADPADLVFTSGGTESNNQAIFGLLAARDPHLSGGGRVVTSAIEHPAVLQPFDRLASLSFEVVHLPVDRHCRVDLAAAAEAITPGTRLVSVMMANNETGTLQPIAELGALCRERGVPFHVDAVQAVGKVPVDVTALGVDSLAFTAHKFHGPKGCGALYVRDGVELAPQMLGGRQEHGRRGGTENVAGIVGLGAAAALAHRDLAKNRAHLGVLRERLLAVRDRLPEVFLNGHPELTVPQTVNLCFLNADALDIQANLNQLGIYASVGSACASGTLHPSHVLKAMGLTDLAAQCSVRFSLGKDNTADELDQVVDELVDLVPSLRFMTSPEDIGVCDENCPCLWE